MTFITMEAVKEASANSYGDMLCHSVGKVPDIIVTAIRQILEEELSDGTSTVIPLQHGHIMCGLCYPSELGVHGSGLLPH